MYKSLTMVALCAVAAFAACSEGVEIADRPSDEGGGGSVASGGSGGAPGPDPQAACADAIADFQACMSLQDFQDLGVYELAYAQSDSGACGSCHSAGEHCAWLGFNVDEMFAKWQLLPCMGDKLVTCVFGEDGTVHGLEPSDALTAYAETANQRSAEHPSALISSELKDALESFINATIARWDSGVCDP